MAELTRHLQGQNPNFAFANSWLEHRLADQGLTIEQLVRAEGQAQAVDQVSIGNSISSLRFLNANNWRRFVSEQSLVEKTLSGDPAGVYSQMDFATRDRYRHVVEEIARRSHFSEYDVARTVVHLANSHAGDPSFDRKAHVGYYLLDRGRATLERQAEMRLTLGVLFEKVRRRYPLSCYLCGVGPLTIASTLLFLQWSEKLGASPVVLILLAIPVLMCGRLN